MRLISDRDLRRLEQLCAQNLCFPVRASLEIAVAYKLAFELRQLRVKVLDLEDQLFRVGVVEGEEIDNFKKDEEEAFRVEICETVDRLVEGDVGIPAGPLVRGRLSRLRAETPQRPMRLLTGRPGRPLVHPVLQAKHGA